MTGTHDSNQIKGKGFRGALRYNLDKVANHVAEVLDSSFVRVAEHSIMKEVQMIRSLKPAVQKYFYHTSINFPPQEYVSSDTMRMIAHDYLQANGFTNHQFILFRHYDADHPHLHILVNRIGYDGKILSDSNDYQRSENILRMLEVKYNLQHVAPSRQATERAMTKDELEMMKRTNQPSHKIRLQIILQEALKGRPSMTEFIRRLDQKNVHVLFNQATTGYVSGISYQLEGFTITGSKLGQNYKWTFIQHHIDYEQERDSAAIRQASSSATDKSTRAKTADRRSTGDRATSKDDNPLYKRAASQSSPAQSPDRTGNRKGRSKQSGDPSPAKGLDLAALLDSSTLGDALRDLVQPPDQLSSVDEGLNQFREKKRKRRRR